MIGENGEQLGIVSRNEALAKQERQRRAAAIRPITVLLSPVIHPATMRFSLNFSKKFATIIIITKEGSTTPNVAKNAPSNSALVVPT